MACERYRDAIQELVDGTLGSIRRAELRSHLEQCDGLPRAARRICSASATRRDRSIALAPPRSRLAADRRPAAPGRPHPAAGGPGRARTRHMRAAGDRGGAGDRRRRARCIVLLPARARDRQPRRRHRAGAAHQRARQRRGGRCRPRASRRSSRLAEQHYQTAIAKLEEAAKSDQTAHRPADRGDAEKNLQVIDQAIAESRAALRAEPKSAPARDSLFEALRRKVALLQDTIALMNEMRKGNAAGAAQLVDGVERSRRDTAMHDAQAPTSSEPRSTLWTALLAHARRRGLRATAQPDDARSPRAHPAVRARGGSGERSRRGRKATRTARSRPTAPPGRSSIGATASSTSPTSPATSSSPAAAATRRPSRSSRPRGRSGRGRARAARPGAGRRDRARRPRRGAGRATRAATRCGATTAATSTCRSPTPSPRRPARGSPPLDLRQRQGARHQGRLALESVSGNVTIANGGRVAAAKTISGNVEITDTEIDGALEASSVSGNGRACAAVKARAADARHGQRQRRRSRTWSASASRCSRSAATSARGRAGAGRPVRAEVALRRGRIALSGDTGFELEASSFSGSVRSDLPLTGSTAWRRARPPAARHCAASTATAAPSSTSRRSPASIVIAGSSRPVPRNDLPILRSVPCVIRCHRFSAELDCAPWRCLCYAIRARTRRCRI